MEVIVIGGGAAGTLAAATSAAQGNSVTLIEKNEKIGKKLYLTGKGRCNLTNADGDSYANKIVRNYKFMLSALHKFHFYDTIDLIERNGTLTKIERGNRVFPLSDKSSDVIKALERNLLQCGAKTMLNTAVNEIIVENGAVKAVEISRSGIKQLLKCDKIVIATGGKSYPSTGSTGDGYTFAKQLGHTVTPLVPALVGIGIKNYDQSLKGVSLKNVTLSVIKNGKCLYSEFGEMLFTHKGISGPIVLSCSSFINRTSLHDCVISIDLKPAISVEQLDKRILSDFEQSKNKQIKNALDKLIIKAMQPILLAKAQINPDAQVNALTKEERKRLVDAFKNLRYEIENLGELSGAIVTSGGVNCDEINAKTMESKIVKGLFFAGEIIDVDACTGGYNLQIAFSTGYAAGLDINK